MGSKDVFRAGQIGPYVELSFEQALMNDAADSSTNFLFYGKAGAGFQPAAGVGSMLITPDANRPIMLSLQTH